MEISRFTTWDIEAITVTTHVGYLILIVRTRSTCCWTIKYCGLYGMRVETDNVIYILFMEIHINYLKQSKQTSDALSTHIPWWIGRWGWASQCVHCRGSLHTRGGSLSWTDLPLKSAAEFAGFWPVSLREADREQEGKQNNTESAATLRLQLIIHLLSIIQPLNFSEVINN